MKNENKLGVYILASGKGSRMGDITEFIPKPLLPLRGKQIIRRLLDYLLNRGIQNINVNYAYLKEKWTDLIEEYNNVSFFDTSNNTNIVENFFYMMMQNKHKYDTIILMSADIFFDYRIIEKAIESHYENRNDVSVILNKYCGKWKKWKYIFNGNKISKIEIADSIQATERYFLILSYGILMQYTKGLTINIGKNEADFKNNIAYGQGLCFLVKNMLDLGIRINYEFYDCDLVNINTIDDFKAAEELAAKLDAE